MVIVFAGSVAAPAEPQLVDSKNANRHCPMPPPGPRSRPLRPPLQQQSAAEEEQQEAGSDAVATDFHDGDATMTEPDAEVMALSGPITCLPHACAGERTSRHYDMSKREML